MLDLRADLVLSEVGGFSRGNMGRATDLQKRQIQAHIPGSEYFGPAANLAMVQRLQKRVEGLPRNKFIVIYCGCCPWSQCPNVKPAYEALHNMGFRKLKVLYIGDNLGMDWVSKGYPIAKGA